MNDQEEYLWENGLTDEQWAKMDNAGLTGMHLQSTAFPSGIAVGFGDSVECAVVLTTTPDPFGTDSMYLKADGPEDYSHVEMKWVPAKLLGMRNGHPLVQLGGVDGRKLVVHESMVRHTINIEDFRRIAEEWNSLVADKERVKFLMDRPEIMICLEHDKTVAAFSINEDINLGIWENIQDIELNALSVCLERSQSVLDLCGLVGIKATLR